MNSAVGNAGELPEGRFRALRRAKAPLIILIAAGLLRVLSGVGFANYDTLYALVWGQQLSRFQTPDYGVAIAPTPHPLIEALGFVLSPLGASTTEQITVALGFIALSACGYIIFQLGSELFGTAVGALAAIIFITRVPVLSNGVRAYVDIPYLLFVLMAMLVESRRPRAGGPVLGLLALAGLLRPEAWAFSGLYWLYLVLHRRAHPEDARSEAQEPLSQQPAAQQAPRQAPSRQPPSKEPAFERAIPLSVLYRPSQAGRPQRLRKRRALRARARGRVRAGMGAGVRLGGRAWAAWLGVRGRVLALRRSERQVSMPVLTLVAIAGPLIWVASDWLITGHPLWSLTNTKDTAKVLGRVTGIGNVPEYLPRRVGEILRVPVLVGAAIGGVLALLRMPARAKLLAITGVAAVLVLSAFTAAGLPLDTRYAFLIAAILSIFCGVGVFGWLSLEPGDTIRRWWMIAGLLITLALIAYIPAQYKSADRQLRKLATEHRIENDLTALVNSGAIKAGCGQVGVPNHAPIPLLALYLKTSPGSIVSSQVREISSGTYLDPADKEVEEDYVLDRKDPQTRTPSIPAGFVASVSNRSWLIFKHCE